MRRNPFAELEKMGAPWRDLTGLPKAIQETAAWDRVDMLREIEKLFRGRWR